MPDDRLAAYAMPDRLSRGRRYPELAHPFRTPYQRDRERVVHSSAFRRMTGKTQVLVASVNDHHRTRLTHTLEVVQVARTVARQLRLNEDLTEAIALAHDIGHPPFGHAGEDALKAAMRGAGGFDHNGHTLRTLTTIERPYPRWNGLNLTWETLEGLAKHNGPVRHPGWALADADAAYPLDLTSWPSLEAQVAAIADDIAYDNHDIDDGLRAGLLTLDQLLAVPLVAQSWDAACARFPDCEPQRLMGELNRGQIGAMVNDLIGETRARIAASGVGSVDDVRAAGECLAGFSPTMREAERDLKRFMYANLYHHPRQVEAAKAAEAIVSGLFAAYATDPAAMPEEWCERLPAEDPQRSRHIADFIAGMTDRYAVTRYREVVGAIDLPEGF